MSFHVLDRSLFPPTPAKTTDEAPPPPKVPVPESLVDPHPLVVRWRKVAEKARTVDGRLALQQSNVLNTRNSPAFIERSAILLDSLCNCCGLDHDYRVRIDSGGHMRFVAVGGAPERLWTGTKQKDCATLNRIHAIQVVQPSGALLHSW